MAELTLPLPAGTVKKAEIVCIITAESLHVRHVSQQKTLLRAEPLSGPVIAEASASSVAASISKDAVEGRES